VFEGFFYELKRKGVPVSLTEWMTLQQALAHGLMNSSLNTFYSLARAMLVKNEAHFDRYDRAFSEYFRGIETPDQVLEKILEGLERTQALDLDELARAQIPELSLDKVLENFWEQYREGHYRQHRGGDRAIGTGGRSTQGAFGYNPAGIRVGQSGGRHGSAIQIAEQRRFRNYDPDLVLDTRQIRVALSRLRTLLPRGPEDELDVDVTIDKTCRNAGDLELVWKRSRKNTVKLLLLMDTGGSMAPYARLVSRLFSAARSQFRDLKYYYFHNCVYDTVWKNMEENEEISLEELMRTLDGDYKVILAGDATMAPSELLDRNGCIDFFQYNDVPGVWRLYQIAHKWPSSVWLNPEPQRFWVSVTARIIGRIFPMYGLTLNGLDDAVRALLRTRLQGVSHADIKEILDRRMSPYR
jgi:uncharacterized protein with von Willebrand factor type A (vWA) domain